MLNIYKQQNRNYEASDASLLSHDEKRVDFRKYVDPTGELDSDQLQYSFWYVRHKVLLYRLTVGGVAVLAAIFWIFSGWQWGNYLIFGLVNDKKVEQSLTQLNSYAGIRQHFAAQPLQVLNTLVLPGGVNKYDALAEMVNPNKTFFVRFTYSFLIGSNKTLPQEAYLLPGERRLVPVLGIESATYPGDALLVLEQVAWSRISNHTVVDPLAWQAERLKFSVSNFKFITPRSSDDAKVNIAQFDLTNESAYSYREPRFYVGLYNQEALVGVLPLRLERMRSLETRHVDVRNFVPTLTATAVQIFPMIDVYDKNVYEFSEDDRAVK